MTYFAIVGGLVIALCIALGVYSAVKFLMNVHGNIKSNPTNLKRKK